MKRFFRNSVLSGLSKTLWYLISIFLLSVNLEAAKTCEFKIGCPTEFNNDTIVIPSNVTYMSSLVELCATSSEPGYLPPSIVFVIDNSGSMKMGGVAKATDVNGYRFTVTKSMIDSIYKFVPNAEVSLVVFSNTLVFNPASPQYFAPYIKSLSYPMFESGTSQDIALHQPVIASSEQGDTVVVTANMVVDGDPASRWSSNFSDSQWIQIDLDTVMPITGVTLDWERSSAKNYIIDVSNDNKFWKTVSIRNNMKSGARIDSITGLKTSARYIRMRGVARNLPYGYSLFRFSVYGRPANPGYLMLMKLDSLYNGKLGKDIIKEVLTTKNATDTAGNQYVDLAYNPVTYPPGNGRNINLGFTAARAALANSVNPRQNQFVVFLSEGKSEALEDPNMNAYIAGSIVPTTFAVCLTQENQAPGEMQTMINNIKINRYSKSNSQSNLWVSRASNLLNLLTSDVISIVRKITQTLPTILTVNAISPSIVKDSVFTFNSRFPLGQDITPFNYTIKNNVKNQTTGVSHDSTVIINFWAKRSNELTPDPRAEIVCWDTTIYTLSVTATMPGVSENDICGKFTFHRDDSYGDLTARFTVSGNALRGVDYRDVVDSVAFKDGVSDVIIDIVPIQDSLTEANETVVFTISENPKYSIGTPKCDTVIINDFSNLVSVTASVPSISENGGAADFEFRRTNSSGDCTVYYKTIGTAEAGVDYENVVDSVILPNGQLTANVAVVAKLDHVVEENENVIVSIDAVRSGAKLNYTLGTPGAAVITITDYRLLMTVETSVDSIPENGGAGVFKITRNDSVNNCTVYYSIYGTAKADIDYTGVFDSVVLQNGQQSVDIAIVAKRDYLIEDGETIVLAIDSVKAGQTTHYTLGGAPQDTLVITDYAVSVSVNAAVPSISEKNGSGQFSISRSDPDGDCTVYYTMSGTAVAGQDYVKISDSLVLKNGENTSAIAITALHDSVAEDNKILTLTIDDLRASRTLNYVTGVSSSTSITIANYKTSVTVSALDTVISEIDKSGRFLLRRSDSSGPCTIHYTLSGFAVNGVDYTELTDSVMIQNGDDSVFVIINPEIDNVEEPAETVVLTIIDTGDGRALEYISGVSNSATMRIVDYTRKITIRASRVSITENKGTENFIVSRTDTVGACTVYFNLNGTARVGADYTASPVDFITFNSGESITQIKITTLQDIVLETNEIIRCLLTAGKSGQSQNYMVGLPGVAEIVINDDTEPFALVPLAANNPFSIGKSFVPDFILKLPGVAVRNLPLSKEGIRQGLILSVEMNPKTNGPAVLSGNVSIYDVLSNVIIKEMKMAFDPGTKRLYYVWGGRNSKGQDVPVGTYLAVFSISGNYQKEVMKKILIGVKR